MYTPNLILLLKSQSISTDPLVLPDICFFYQFSKRKKKKVINYIIIFLPNPTKMCIKSANYLHQKSSN